jgi:predicted RNase H-like nuclease (RuvC/YqgF family)
MAKSIHPKLMKKALKDIADLARDLKQEDAALKAVASACDNASKLCSRSAGDFKSQYGYLQGVIEKYAKKCVEIQELEKKLDGAKGDKKAQGELKKQVAAADKQADALRTEYNNGCKAVSALSQAINETVDGIAATSGKLMDLAFKA